MTGFRDLRAFAEDYVVAIERIVREYESIIADTSALAIRLEDLRLHRLAAATRDALREHQVKLLLHRGNLLAAQGLFDELWRNTRD